MDFTILVLGDVRLFADTLNGIAMIFTVANGERIDLWASNTNGMGLGMGAFLGMMLAICSLVYNAAFKQKFDFAAIIFPLILYIILTVPKVTVNVVDGYYRDGSQTVANVPIGLALPLSVISGIAFTATEKLETVFTVPSNGTFTKITEDGFVMPLKLIHALRYTGLTMRDGYPNMSNSLIEITKICLTNNKSFHVTEYQKSSDSLGYIIASMGDIDAGKRLVKIYPHDQRKGKVVMCNQAIPYLKGTLQAYMDGTIGENIPTLISSDMAKQKNLKTDIEKLLSTQSNNSGNRNLTDTSTMRILDDIQNFTNVSNDEAIQFIQASILNPQMSDVAQCITGNSNAEIARCLSYKTSEEQWKEKSAAEASGFLSIMRDGQNLLILLSITLFPIMVLVIAINGMGGLKVVGSYFLYTVSAYLWIPVAAMINWYTQVQLHEELEKWTSRLAMQSMAAQNFLSLANAPLFYDAVSKKLAVANTVMASVPLICMGVFSGMLWGMNRLVDKMNPQSEYNPSVNTPEVLDRKPIANVGDAISFDGYHAAGKMNALPEAATLAKIQEAAKSAKQAEVHLENAADSAAKALGERLALSKDNSEARQLARQMLQSQGFTDETSKAFQTAESSVLQGMADFELGHKITNSERVSDDLMKQAAASLKVDMGVLKAKRPWMIGAALSAEGRQKIGAGLSTSKDINTDAALNTSTTGSTQNSQAATSTHSQTSSQRAANAVIGMAMSTTNQSEQFKQTLDNSHSYQNNLANVRSEEQAYQEQLRTAATTSLTSSQIANMDVNTGGKLSQAIDGVWQKYGDDPAVKGRHALNLQEFTNTSGTHNRELNSRLDALLNSGKPEIAAAAYKAMGAVGEMMGGNFNGDHIASPSQGVYGVRDNVLEKTADANKVTAPNTSKEKIMKDHDSRKGETEGTMGAIEQQANRVAEHHADGVRYGEETEQVGRGYLDNAYKAQARYLKATTFTNQNENGDNVKILPNSNFVGAMYNISGDEGSKTYMYETEEMQLLKDKRNGGLTAEQEKRLGEIKQRENDMGTISYLGSRIGARFAMIGDVLEKASGAKGFNESGITDDGAFVGRQMTLEDYRKTHAATGATAKLNDSKPLSPHDPKNTAATKELLGELDINFDTFKKK